MESTASDVSRQWGAPESRSPDYYTFKDYNILITYSSGTSCEAKCIELGFSSGWNAPRDTLITAAFMIKASMQLKDLGIDLSKFKRERASDFGNGIYIFSDEEGIGITVEGDEITNISLFPAKKYLYRMCNGLANKRQICPKINSNSNSISGEFAPQSDEKEIAEKFEARLQHGTLDTNSGIPPQTRYSGPSFRTCSRHQIIHRRI